MHNDETIAESLVFSDEATLLTSCKANRHNLRVCCTENLATLENQRNSPKVNLQDGAPPHFHRCVPEFLNVTLPYYWTGDLETADEEWIK
jgi:hypothetical protein